ncbi:unnamed protein product [Meganyctiphanes norvegica]|uniref:Josephin-2 n=1 Tax=Meganyctiphanes norvegica TaxID=48144 RepID=A0AAV2SBS1_MEGNR
MKGGNRCLCGSSNWFWELLKIEENIVGVAMTPDLYHEKQVAELCALHSLNNLFQDSSAFSKTQLDSICYALSPDNWFNPHKSLLGTGNYDINVIMSALTTKGCAVVWFDKRKDPNIVALEKVVGFILNVPSEYRLGPVQLPLRRKHWVAIRSIRGVYYNLDSKLEAPEIIGKENELRNYLREELKCKDKEVFLIVTQEVEHYRSWNNENKLSDNEFIAAVASSLEDSDSQSSSFNPPGFKYIDQETASIENQLDGIISSKDKEENW